MNLKTLFPGLPAALAAALLIMAVSACNRESFVLSPEYNYSIVTGTGADSLTVKAASELKEYYSRITGKPLPVTVTAEPGTKIIFIGKSGLGESPLKTEITSLSSDGFIISSSPDTLILAGNNGTNWRAVASRKFETTRFNQDIVPVNMEFEFAPQELSKLRITAKSLKKCPEWHRGAGQPSWIFIDEIVVE